MYVQDYIDYGMAFDIYVQFNPCNTDSFICESTMEFGGEEFVEDCTEQFLDPEWWSEFSNDPWWQRAENQQMYPFYMFWNEYHSHSDNDGTTGTTGDDSQDCYDVESHMRCSDF
jgi:hypothetical protein